MSKIEIRALRRDEVGDFVWTFRAAFHGDSAPEGPDFLRDSLPIDRSICAVVDGNIAGVTSSFPFEINTPGSSARAAGIIAVGVLPTHRRRGILRGLMRRQLADARDAGEPLAVLWASESSIYHRLGFGMAIRAQIGRLDRTAVRFRDNHPNAGRMRLVSTDDARTLLPPLYDRAMLDVPGALRRTPDWWSMVVLADRPWQRMGAGPLRIVVHSTDGIDDGYAMYRTSRSWDPEGLVDGYAIVVEALGSTPAVVHALWRYLVNIDLVGDIRPFNIPLDHPLPLMLDDPRQLRLHQRDGVWLRIVDLPAALRGRSYAAPGELVVEVRDADCSWNAGNWRLNVGDAVVVEPTSRSADISLDVGDLGAAYLGGVSFNTLRQSTRAVEHVPGCIQRADAMFRTDRQPWFIDDF
jgi:predicted acetyltransferase